MATPKKTAEGSWRIQIMLRGQRLSGTFPSRREAIDWAADKAHESKMTRAGRVGEMKTLSDAMRRYAAEISPRKKGARWEAIRLAAFEAHPTLPCSMPIANIQPHQLVTWRDARVAQTSTGTALREMTLLASVFEAARREWAWLTENPMREVRRPKQPQHRDRIITASELRQMLRSLKWDTTGQLDTKQKLVGQAIMIALSTGMRAGEICAARWEDYNGKRIKLHDSKIGIGRDVPLSRQARKHVSRCKGASTTHIMPIGTAMLDALFRKARMNAGLSGFTFHDTRHAAATRLAKRPGFANNMLNLTKAFGWKDPKRVMTYYNPTADDIADQLG